MSRRIYVASSWRNSQYFEVVHRLRQEGHQVFDFRNPWAGNKGFHWSEIDEDWKGWSPETYVRTLTRHALAARGFMTDFRAMKWADTCVLVRPCGRSAHLELGWMAGAGKRTIILLAQEPEEPELMVLLADDICLSLEEVVERLA